MDDEGELHGTSLRHSRTCVRVIRSLVYRNLLSAVLLVVAVVGIVVQLREIHLGIVLPQARLVLTAYILIALYAIASIALRLRGKKPKA